MMVVRSGIPQIIPGTAVQLPAGAVVDADVLAAKWVSDTPTTWVRIHNTDGAHALRVYLNEDDFRAKNANFEDVAVGLVFEGPYELHQKLGLYLAGVGGTATFKLVIAQRI